MGFFPAIVLFSAFLEIVGRGRGRERMGEGEESPGEKCSPSESSRTLEWTWPGSSRGKPPSSHSRAARKRDGKNREPGERRTPPSATENTAGSFARLCRGRLRTPLFFSRLVSVHFAPVLIFIHSGKILLLYLSPSLIFPKLWPLVNIVRFSWIISVYVRQRWKLTGAVNVAAKLFNRHALLSEKLSRDDFNVCVHRKG